MSPDGGQGRRLLHRRGSLRSLAGDADRVVGGSRLRIERYAAEPALAEFWGVDGLTASLQATEMAEGV